MELLQEIGRKEYGSGFRKFGLFLCPICKEKLEKSLSHGKRDKNCGSKECRKATFVPNQRSAEANTKHGFSRESQWSTFERMHYAMVHRCHNEKDDRYASYGGSGISVCDRWQNLTNFAIDMFPSYKALAVLGDGTKAMRPAIDRKDPFGDYSPENCEWITYGENSAKDKRIPVVRMDYEGNVLELYDSMTLAAAFEMPFGCKTIKATLSNIHDCCNGVRKDHLGYRWGFATSKTSMQKHDITQ
jgi:hypothetical protein